MNNEKKLGESWEIKLSRDAEQAEAGTETVALLTILYYQKLIQSRMPEKTAAYLTATWLSAQFGQKNNHV